jgi:6-phosphofructokinase
MDNDLPITDTCPGFGSVAKYTAVSIREASFDLASMAKTSTKVFILEVMGRHAGWTAAAGGLAAQTADDGPQVILFPEIVFDEAKFLAKVDSVVKKVGWCTIVASEGLHAPSGEFLSEAGGKDAFGHAQLGGLAPLLAKLLKDKLGLKYHWAVADYLMRAARHVASRTDLQQSYAVGKHAVELAIRGKSGVMATIERLSDKPYKWRTGEAPLEKVANVEKKMPRDFITADGFHITDKCRRYLAPLIAGEDYPKYKDGLPQYVKLRNVAVPKKCGAFEYKK